MDKNEFDEILIYAISNEVEAEEFYLEASEKLADPFMKNLFLKLSHEEKKHQKILEGFRGRATVEFQFKEVPDYHISEKVERPKLSTAMKPADAFALALKKEEDAMNHYKNLAAAVSDKALKKVFQELSAMEREHKIAMENAFMDVGYPEVW
jgi:rubrerythrin